MTDKKNLGRVSLFLATLIWGVSFVLMDLTLNSVPALYILAIRFLGAAVILLAVGARELKKIDRGYIRGGVVMGVILLAAYCFQTFGLPLTTPGKNAFLTSVYCVMVPFLYWFIIKKRPDKYNVIAGVVCLAGIGFISLDNHFAIGLGDGLTLICGFLYAVHMVICGAVVEERSPILVSMLQFAVAGVLAAIMALIFQPAPTHIPVSTVWVLVFLTVMSTALCLSLQIFGQKHTPTAQASVIMTFEAVFGAATSVLFYGETLTLRLVIGFLLTFAAVLISETKLGFFRKKATAASAKETITTESETVELNQTGGNNP
ncbi:Permease of the drug/metabolite transporter (DMT) superfamily [Sporobacter termitidis DSM 10068]|uniref:Permease of the drug/metabolite transporter (DMT) superfamily n=1 Tax=Sporobacter termitidis DSM 10068 TaxID=1123282 RepID=A0A1M5VJ07_9FIRM|nr:DMT family transporter [Sporobacter termitidis]SHH75239.1 Permease of the drug/metabolite transporter (DMT) superfamily [Sporobacter termitidis DSM 10068]